MPTPAHQWTSWNFGDSVLFGPVGCVDWCARCGTVAVLRIGRIQYYRVGRVGAKGEAVPASTCPPCFPTVEERLEAKLTELEGLPRPGVDISLAALVPTGEEERKYGTPKVVEWLREMLRTGEIKFAGDSLKPLELAAGDDTDRRRRGI